MKNSTPTGRKPDLSAVNAESRRIGKELRRISNELKVAMWANDNEKVKSLMRQNGRLQAEALNALKSLMIDLNIKPQEKE